MILQVEDGRGGRAEQRYFLSVTEIPPKHRSRNNCRSYARQTSVFDARYQGMVRIEYPLHPLFGREGKVVRRVRYDFGTYLEVEIDQAIVNLPHWMTRADLCGHFTCGLDPVPQRAALRQVLQLLDDRHL